MAIPAILATVGGALASGLLQRVLGGNPASTPTPADGATQTLGKDDFLRLMLAQLRNQDPLNPMDNTQFVAQTAQFSSLEQLQSINATVAKLAARAGTGDVANASALLGKTVTVNGSALSLDGTRPVTIDYTLPKTAAAVAVRVFDPSGNAVRTILVGQQGGGPHRIAFDGLDDSGRRLPDGEYLYQVAAADATGAAIAGAYTGDGRVTGLNVEGNTLMLLLGARRVPLSAVVGVMGSGVL
jgi:flagellar basal-body rod modification protein FlgD